MIGILQWIGDVFRAVVGTMILLTPGVVFWLVAIGIIAVIQQWKIWESLKVVASRWQRRWKKERASYQSE